MLKFRTTKEVAVSLQTEETAILEFQFSYKTNIDESIEVTTNVYYVTDEGITLIGGGGGPKRPYTKEQVNEMLSQAEAITPDNDNPLEYVHDLFKSGIKLVIVAESLWKGVLSIEDFE